MIAKSKYVKYVYTFIATAHTELLLMSRREHTSNVHTAKLKERTHECSTRKEECIVLLESIKNYVRERIPRGFTPV